MNIKVTSATKVLAMQLADTMSTLLAPFLTLRSAQDQEGCIVKYAPRYRLAFTLLNEDAASGNAAIAWDVREAISKHITPTLDRLSILHNFTIESQIQFHAPLAFEPRTLEIDNMVKFGLIQEDLTVFINSAEWTLSSSVSSDPVLHFVLFLPSWRNRPLHILSDDGVAVSNAFILPQWGGITILNPMSSSPGPLHLTASSLDTVFLTFRHQLLALLGVPKLPISIQSNQSAIFTDWQLDALLRRRAAENVEGGKETLRSIVNLVAQINNMPVGQDVRGDVQDALTALDEAYSAASFSSAHTLRHSSRALTLASRAFFSPGMLALLYFPAEHKYAVYTPLFASIAAPLIAAVVREILAQRRAYRAAHEKYVTKAESTTRRTKAD
ncbi:hypothetical protein AcW1_009330 [Taiwanofungus camphoratus]|nr:hypothetical protein AcV5_003405 [Antrodia cinnamomea]KAI0935079.1 hypothetical protein AcV7_003985 [Antrodia cinnamomea]KAI0947620.1 hypothetical protein AcW1_009330 [Antrodia cinnamomea]